PLGTLEHPRGPANTRPDVVALARGRHLEHPGCRWQAEHRTAIALVGGVGIEPDVRADAMDVAPRPLHRVRLEQPVATAVLHELLDRVDALADGERGIAARATAEVPVHPFTAVEHGVDFARGCGHERASTGDARR